MLCLENVRFEILRDPIVHDFSLNLQHSEVKALGRAAVARRRFCV